MFPISSHISPHYQPIPTNTAHTPNSLYQNAMEHVRTAEHLQSSRPLVEQLLYDLMQHGHINISESDPTRFAAVAGVQWAMEKTLSGVEFIITPERATPFRTHGDTSRPASQAVREAVLIERLENSHPLHLVFCQGGEGTPEQDAKYQAEIFTKYGADTSPNKTLFEHQLPLAKKDFPQELSGAIIFTKKEDTQFAFAIRAAQADKLTQSKSLDLFFGAVERNTSASMDTLHDAHHSANEIANAWQIYLEEMQTGIDCFGMALSI